MKTGQRGLFLDLDGTLADSLPVMRAVYGRFLETYGKCGNDAEFITLNGPPLADIVAILKHKHRLEPPVGDLLDAYWPLVFKAYSEVRPNPGAGNLLDRATGLGWKVGVVTSSCDRIAQGWLRQCGLGNRVSVIVGGESVRTGKPGPEPYLLALKRSNCSAAVSIAVEDSPTGAQSAIAAEIPTFVVNDQRIPAGRWPNIQGFIRRLDDLIGYLDA